MLPYILAKQLQKGIGDYIKTIFPMTALATDQAKRIAELIHSSDDLRGNVTVGMYVGGQGYTPACMMSEHGILTDHETMPNNASDILMTSYKILDYLLACPKDAFCCTLTFERL